MRIVCENCGTKYSIADEKVRGKVFKIRCKKCGHIIVVKGTPATQAAGDSTFDDKETRVFDYNGFEGEGGPAGGQEPVWHVVIDKEDVGPLTAEQVREKFASGEVDADTYIWRDGYADWVRLGAVEEFADMEGATVAAAASPFGAGAAAAAAAASQPEPQSSAPSPFDEPQAAAPDPFAAPAAEPQPQADPFGGAGAPAAAADANLFGGGGEVAQPQQAGGGSDSLFGGGGGGRGSLFPEEEEDDQPKPAMTGQRNENSVLFSLSNLQALATGGPKKSPTVGLSSSGGSGSKDGSGLLDIRAMAASTVAASEASAGPGFSDPVAVPSPFAGPIAAPVLMPVASDRPKWLIPVLVGGGVLLVTVIVLGIIVVMRMGKKPKVIEKRVPAVAANDKAEDMGASPMDATESSMAADMGAASPDMAAPSGTAPSRENGMEPAANDAREATSARSPRGSRSSHRSRSSRRHGSSSSFRPARSSFRPSGGGIPGLSPSRPRRSRGGSNDPLAALLSRAARSRSARSARSDSRPAAVGKPSLTRGDIKSAISRVKGGVQRCYDKYKVAGMIRVRVVVSGSSGRVSSASIRGKFSGTPTGRCVARAVRRARFPKFARPSQSFTYPFILR